ncbi:uncharacterized protein LOC129887201 isoform X1 [Solanum dulcamara]|uniref:uncharacterized protein LOC129887201 isoform X1 n=1 Tax=Solanum dulcamara TaxID=45834 RepID=UPI0024854918|nr:uncharacterized protein LOC129887201 isoform X1 [Solanum dulcamara]
MTQPTYMDRQQTPNVPPPLRPTVHQDDADQEDETVKQLNECSSVYLSLQDCLINSDRNWKSCQKAEGLSETAALPFKVEVRSAYTLPS